MEIATRQIGGERLALWLVIFLGLVLSIFTGFLLGTDAATTSIVLLAIGLSITWIAIARRRWWLLMPAASAVGGYFWFGFKLYPHELALLGCFAPLLIARAVSTPGMLQRDRPSFPFAMYLLSGYLFAHWAGSNIYNRIHGQAGYGNVSRAYFNALGVILFLFAFRRYGSTKYIPAALAISYLAAFARVFITIITYLTQSFAYIPIVNYVLPGSTHSGAADLRSSGLMLATVAVCYFLIHKGFLRKSFHAAIFLGSIVALLFGAGRTAVVLVCLFLLFAALVHRKIIPLLLFLLAVSSLVFALNTHFEVLNNTPYVVQRAASGLLLNKEEAAHYGKTQGSDEWHSRLRQLGYKKWTQSWNTFLFGTGIRPFDNAMYEMIPGKSTWDDMIESSSKVGAYESGWWTVLAVTGLFGMILYLAVLLYLLRRLLPSLLKNRVRDHAHAFAFMGVFQIIIWFVLGWTNGGFPSGEMMLAFLGAFALADQQRQRPSLTEPAAALPVSVQRAELVLVPQRGASPYR